MIVPSPYVAVEIPRQSIPDYVFERVDQWPDRAAMIDPDSGAVLTYAELRSLAHRCAAGLAARGFQQGDIFAIYAPNLAHYPIIHLGVLLLGGIVAPLNPLLSERELTHLLHTTGATRLITVAGLLPAARVAAAVTNVGELFVFGDASGLEGVEPLSVLLADSEEHPTPTIDPQQDLAMLPCSSGTTGMPKAVMLTHEAVVASVEVSEGRMDMVAGDVMIGILPFFHIYGSLIHLHSSLRRGATTIPMPRFDPEQFLRLHQEHRATVAFVVPPIMNFLARHPLVSQYDLSSVRSILSGAAPLSPEVVRMVHERLGAEVHQGYGMTEAVPTHVNRADAPVESVGPALRNTICRIADIESGELLGAGATGELQIQGPQMMRGYLGDAQATGESITADGWLRTGDVGYIDAGGNLHIVDRLKEMIKYNAWQIAPAELEALLMSHPQVTDAAVVGIPNEETGEIPKGFIVPTAGETIDEPALLAWVAAEVAPYKRLRALELVETIPRSASGKILRRELRARELERMGIATEE